jgi:hypothetical protein
MPLPEEMPAGRVQCRALCSSYARDFDAYTYEGACVCKPDPKAHQQYNGNQTRRTGWPHSKGST